MRKYNTTDGGTLECDELDEVVTDQHGYVWIWNSDGAFAKHGRAVGHYEPAKAPQTSNDGEVK